jgi:alginate O-acetyltransferase complex protein AlgI
MFMFRLLIYMYDLKHCTAPFSPSRAISYFFLLPNVCFFLFPVVDYKSFCSTYYNEDWPRVYQTGLKWMFRGAIQLLLYRVIYQFAPLDVYKLSSALDAAGCMLGMYLLYLRISGTFHLIVGLLHMFGFNLLKTHHLYLLAFSFTDFWRRINIYWKDFVMKLFFYPTHFALRKVGPIRAMSVATVVTFIATWLAVSYAEATPLAIESDPRTYNLDPNRIESVLTPQTKAIIPVHLYRTTSGHGSDLGDRSETRTESH